MAQDQQQVTDALFLGNLDPRVSKRVLYDICIQVCLSDVQAPLLVLQKSALSLFADQLKVICCAGWASRFNQPTRS